MKLLIITYLVLILIHTGYSKVLDNCVCGQESDEGLIVLRSYGHRIVNGTEVRPHKYPWMAVMIKNSQHVCGGTIISDKNILTAGHCVYYAPKPTDSYWVVGSHNVKKSQIRKKLSYKTKDYRLHPSFTPGNLFDKYDICIITVERRIIFDNAVKPICLPNVGDEMLFRNREVKTAGWGRTSENGLQTDVLLETTVYLKSQRECKKMASSIQYDDKSMICAHKQYTDACQGDSGGPLFADKSHNHYIIIGVTSFGDGCARDFPGIYAKLTVPATLRWIYKMISSTGSNVCRNPKTSSIQRRL